MTTPRDQLVVIEELREALTIAVAAYDSIVHDEYDGTGSLLTEHLSRIDKARTALSASAQMPAQCGCVAGGAKCHYHNKHPQIPVVPAPERVGVEEVIRAMHSFEASCIVFGATTMGKNDRAITECHSLMNDKRAALESAVRRLGGGE